MYLNSGSGPYLLDPVLRTRIRDPGYGIGCLFDPWIRDPGWEKVSILIRDEQPGSYFLELRNHFFAFWGLKYLNSLMRIRDPGWKKVGSGINIPDPPH
jgi:hypothetical protein